MAIDLYVFLIEFVFEDMFFVSVSSNSSVPIL